MRRTLWQAACYVREHVVYHVWGMISAYAGGRGGTGPGWGGRVEGGNRALGARRGHATAPRGDPSHAGSWVPRHVGLLTLLDGSGHAVMKLMATKRWPGVARISWQVA